MKEKTKIWHELIKEARISKGLTQQYMADHIDMTRRSYIRIESGTQWPSYDTLRTICIALNVKISIP